MTHKCEWVQALAASLRLSRAAVMTAALVTSWTVGLAAHAASEAVKHFDIRAKPLADALMEFGVQSGLTVVAPSSLTAGKHASAVHGELPLPDALRQLLKGSSLTFARATDGSINILPVRAGASVGLGADAIDPVNDPPTPSEGADAAELDEIVVTAEKRNSTVQKTPISLTAISGDQLMERGVFNVEGIAAEVPGISMRSAGPGQTEYEMRGLSSAGGASPTVGFYLDETPLTSPAAALNGKVVIDPDLFDLNRVEVLRGPQGTLYGSGSMGGTIKLITNQPKLSIFEAAVDASLSGTPGAGVNPGLSGMLNLPIIDDKVAIRIVGTEKYTSGWIDRIVVNPFPIPTNQGCTPTPFEGCNRGTLAAVPVTADSRGVNWEWLRGARISMLAKPIDELSIDFAALYQRITMGGYSTYDASFGQTPSVPGVLAHYEPFDTPEPFADTYHLYRLTVTYNFDFASLTSASSYWSRLEEQTQDLSEDIQNDFFLPQFYPASLQEIDTSNQLSEELRLASAGRGRWQWLGGIFYSKLSSTYLDIGLEPDLCFLSTGGCGANPLGYSYDADNPYTIDQYAVFGEVSYDLTRHLKLTAGVRQFTFRNNENYSQYGYLTGSGNATPTAGAVASRNDGTNPKLNLSYEPSDDLTVYGTIAKGFRPGGVNLPIPVTGPASCLPGLVLRGLTNAPLSYGPDSIWSYELGEKARLFEGRFSINGDIYYNQWKGVQLISALPCGYPYTDNAGNAVTYGPELEVTARLGSGFTLAANGAYTHAELTEATIASGFLSGSPLVNVPKYTESTSLTYVRSTLRNYTFTARISNSLVGPTTDVAYLTHNLPSYDLVNLRLGLNREAWSGSLFVSNLTDKRAELTTNNTNITFNSPDVTRVSTNQPRTVGVELLYRY